MLEEYIYCGTKKLRCGYTTGSCAAAAAKASAQMLLTGMTIDKVSLMTPKGILLELNIKNSEIETDYAECAIKKRTAATILMLQTEYLCMQELKKFLPE